LITWKATLRIFVAAFALSCASIALPNTSHAASTSTTATCNASSTTNLTLYIGEQLTIATSGLCTRILGADGGLGGTGTLTYISGGNTVNYPIGTGGTPGLDNPSTVIYTGTVIGGARVEIRDSGGGGVIQSWDVTVVTAPTSPSLTTNQTPAPLLQQFGKPSSGTCDAVAPESLNWSDVASGGWGESWAQWMNGGSGGAVCTRTLVYSTEQSRWVIG
jgi:hypothetical protein